MAGNSCGLGGGNAASQGIAVIVLRAGRTMQVFPAASIVGTVLFAGLGESSGLQAPKLHLQTPSLGSQEALPRADTLWLWMFCPLALWVQVVAGKGLWVLRLQLRA